MAAVQRKLSAERNAALADVWKQSAYLMYTINTIKYVVINGRLSINKCMLCKMKAKSIDTVIGG